MGRLKVERFLVIRYHRVNVTPKELESALENERRLRVEAETQLRRVKADFQEFTSRIAHDLREPLRTVSSYCQLLANRFGDPKDEDATLFMRYIHDAVERAQVLLAGVVEYSTVDADKRHPVPVDMNTVYAEATRHAARPEVFQHEKLPVVVGEFDLLVSVMRHLFANAVKFAGRPDAAVQVSSQKKDQDWIIAVRDNGPGIDPAHHERVFGLFRRLHGRDIPGCGMGLAYSRKAIESLGGQLWLESSPGEGSTFFFSLPADE